MAVTAPGQTSLEKNVTICAKDSSGPYDLNLKKDLIKCAKKNNLAFCVDIYPYYGSDASAALRAGHNIQAGLIGPGVASSHSYERTHIEGILNTAALITSFLNSKNTRDQ
jgi:putative aminopeptidase FrvX